MDQKLGAGHVQRVSRRIAIESAGSRGAVTFWGDGGDLTGDFCGGGGIEVRGIRLELGGFFLRMVEGGLVQFRFSASKRDGKCWF